MSDHTLEIVSAMVSLKIRLSDGRERTVAGDWAYRGRGLYEEDIRTLVVNSAPALTDQAEREVAVAECDPGVTPIMFCGHGRAGKDLSAKYFADVVGARYNGSLSWTGLPVVAARLGLCHQEAWDTRHDRRMEWKAVLDDYRRADPARLVRDGLAAGPVLVGVRDGVELRAALADGLVRHAVWVNRPGTPPDPTVTYTAADCTTVLENPGDSKAVLYDRVVDLANRLGYRVVRRRLPE